MIENTTSGLDNDHKQLSVIEAGRPTVSSAADPLENCRNDNCINGNAICDLRPNENGQLASQHLKPFSFGNAIAADDAENNISVNKYTVRGVWEIACLDLPPLEIIWNEIKNLPIIQG